MSVDFMLGYDTDNEDERAAMSAARGRLTDREKEFVFGHPFSGSVNMLYLMLVVEITDVLPETVDYFFKRLSIVSPHLYMSACLVLLSFVDYRDPEDIRDRTKRVLEGSASNLLGRLDVIENVAKYVMVDRFGGFRSNCFGSNDRWLQRHVIDALDESLYGDHRRPKNRKDGVADPDPCDTDESDCGEDASEEPQDECRRVGVSYPEPGNRRALLAICSSGRSAFWANKAAELREKSNV